MGRDYYILKNGRLKRKDNTIYFEESDNTLRYLPIEDVDKIHLFGEVDVNSKLLTYLARYGVILNFYNYYGYYSGSYYPRKQNVSGYLLVKQVEHYSSKVKRLYLAKAFVESGIFHMLRNLRRYRGTEEYIDIIEDGKYKLYETNTVEEVMGIEGSVRKVYYSAFNSILKNGFSMEKREKRPPKDPINVLISLGNSLMYTAVLGEIYKTQLDPTVSYLHEPSTKRFSLSLDIAEIFKPLVIDPLIFNVINNRIISWDDFQEAEGFCTLTDEGKRRFISEFDAKMSTTIKHRKLNRKVSYRGFIRIECYSLIKHLLSDEIYKPLKAWW